MLYVTNLTSIILICGQGNCLIEIAASLVRIAGIVIGAQKFVYGFIGFVGGSLKDRIGSWFFASLNAKLLNLLSMLLFVICCGFDSNSKLTSAFAPELLLSRAYNQSIWVVHYTPYWFPVLEVDFPDSISSPKAQKCHFCQCPAQTPLDYETPWVCFQWEWRIEPEIGDNYIHLCSENL